MGIFTLIHLNLARGGWEGGYSSLCNPLTSTKSPPQVPRFLAVIPPLAWYLYQIYNVDFLNCHFCWPTGLHFCQQLPKYCFVAVDTRLSLIKFNQYVQPPEKKGVWYKDDMRSSIYYTAVDMSFYPKGHPLIFQWLVEKKHTTSLYQHLSMSRLHGRYTC